MPEKTEDTAATSSPGSPRAPADLTAKDKRAQGKPAAVLKQRRRFVWAAVWTFVIVHLLMFIRFFFPRALFEPKQTFTIGTPEDFALGVDTRFQQTRRIWVVRKPDRLFVIFARCTHLGCTPDWKEGENKFKCPCHGSGFDTDGVNFEGPAPRPMDRAHVEIDPTGQLVVNTGKLYKCDRGGRCEFDDPGAYLV